MLTDNLFLKFQGFRPSNFTRNDLNEKMAVLQDEAPDGSSLQATFTQDGSIFKGSISIHSCCGKFFASASDPKFKEVTGKLISQIREQLSLWKTTRFASKDLKRALFYDENYNKEENHENFCMA